MTTRGELLVGLFDFLERRGVEHVLLGRVCSYPAQVDSDVDIAIRGFHPDAFLQLMLEFSRDTGLRCIQVMQHETSASYFALSVAAQGAITILHPDACGDYRRQGRLWLTEEELLSGRKQSPNGFWVPSDGMSLIYYLIKCLGKRRLASEHLTYLQALYAHNPAECDQALRKHFGAMANDLAAGLLRAGVAAMVSQDQVDGWSRRMQALPCRETVPSRARHQMGEGLRVLRRMWRPSGLTIGFLGPDGSGKSTLIEHVSRELRPAFRQYHYFHLRPGAFFGKRRANPAAVRDPHGQVPRSALASVAKLMVLMIDYVAGHATRIWPLKVRSSLIVFDRYLQDMLADPRRYRWAGPRWLLTAVSRLVPSPDVWVVLDAPAAVLLARKAEVSLEGAEAQRLGYQRLLTELGDVIQVRTDGPLDDAVSEVLEQLTQRLERRVVAAWGP